jgi:hypothetical protein
MGLLPQGDSKRGHVGAVQLTGSATQPSRSRSTSVVPNRRCELLVLFGSAVMSGVRNAHQAEVR